MNFISHYFCLQNKHPYSTLGVVLPDIIPHFSYLHNKYFLHFDRSLLNEEERYLWLGIENHYTDDMLFHSMSDFKQGMKRIEAEMQKSELKELKRRYLVSHVLYELILDHMILERSPDILTSFYDDLEQIKIEKVKNFLEKIIGDNAEISILLDSYDRFINRRFLSFYSVDSNLVKSLHMVSGKISQWDYSPSAVNAFTEIVRKMKNEIDFDQVFESIRRHKKRM